MKFEEYQQKALSTAQYPSVEGVDLPIYPALGLLGECGEFADKVKKAWRNKTDLDGLGLMRELGDIMWYAVVAAYHIGCTPSSSAPAHLPVGDRVIRMVRGAMKMCRLAAQFTELVCEKWDEPSEWNLADEGRWHLDGLVSCVHALAHELDYTLAEVMAENIAKLADRQKRDVIKGEGDNR